MAPHKWICDVCPRTFPRRGRLEKHRLVHSAPDVLNCGVCGKQFMNRTGLFHHERTHLQDERCPSCPKTFNSARALKQHVQRVHGPKAPAAVRRKCRRCARIFPSCARLFHHFSTVHTPEKMCDRCHGLFKSSQDYRQHRLHCKRARPGRRHLCVHCKRRFLTKVALLAHQLSCALRHRKLQGGAGQRRPRKPRRRSPAQPQEGMLVDPPLLPTSPDPRDVEEMQVDQPSQETAREQEEEESRPSVESSNRDEWIETQSAFRRAVWKLYLPTPGQMDLGLCLIGLKDRIVQKVQEEFGKCSRGLKWTLNTRVLASKEESVPDKPGQTNVRQEEKIPHGLLRTTFEASVIKQQVEESILEVVHSAEHLQLQGSGWVVSEVLAVELSMSKCAPLKGGSYIPTPEWLRRRKNNAGVINVKTIKDNDCFRLSILAAIHRLKEHADRPEMYEGPHFTKLEFGNINAAPMELHNIKRFEELNPNISITVLGLDKTSFYPLYTPTKKKENHVTLLLLAEGEGEDAQRHYVAVRDIHALLHKETKFKGRKWFCCYCLNHCHSSSALEEHEERCRAFGGQRTVLPKEGSSLSFDTKHYQKCEEVPFVCYYDFETLVRRIPKDKQTGGGRTRRIQEHIPVGYSIVVVNSEGKLVTSKTYAAKAKVAEHFLTTLVDLENELWYQRPDFPIDMSDEQEREFQLAVDCSMCGKPLKGDRVRDHNHFRERSNYNSALHSNCNALKRRPTFLPVIAHNANHYDLHLIMRAIPKHPRLRKRRVQVIPKTQESYRGVTIDVAKGGRRLKFMDSFQFYGQSLDTIAKSLREEDLGLLEEVFPDAEQRALLRSKTAFPYEFAQTYSDLVQQRELPEREHFYSSLSDSLPSEVEYERARRVWEQLGCKNLLDYMKMYMLLDTVLLAAFFTRYREVSYKKYGLEVCHFTSAPGLSFQAAFKFSRAVVELITDPTMYQFFEKQMRGGFTFVGKRYSEANVPGTSTYKPSLPEKHIVNTDANALYSHEMKKKLPIGEFTWQTKEELEKIDWENLDVDGEFNYVLEVCLEYPKSLHQRHSDFPCAVESRAVPEIWMSEYQRGLCESCPISAAQFKQPKLVAHLGPREKYVVHATVLQLYLKLGLKITSIVRGVRFRQEAWLAPYIDDLMDARQKSSIKFVQEYLKLMSNSCYGQLLRNPRFDRDIEIIRSEKRLRKVVAKPSFKSFTIFGEDMIAVEKLPTKIKLDKCVFAGTTVLDYSKKTMLELYWTMKQQFEGRMAVLFSDTDSICVEVESSQLNDELAAIGHIFDMSGFPPSHPLYSTEHQRVTGRLKVEYGDCNILKFVGLRAKCYALSLEAKDQDAKITEVLKCKGVQKAAMKRSVSFEDYKRCLFDHLQKEVEFCSLRTDGKHRIYTQKQTKVALRYFDNKRWICPDGIHTKAYRPGMEEEMEAEDEEEMQLRELVALLDGED